MPTLRLLVGERGVCAIALCSIVGCANSEQATAVQAYSFTRTDSAGGILMGVDAAFARVAQSVPSFAGIVYKDGAYTIALTNLADSVRAADIVARELEGRIQYAPPELRRMAKPILRFRTARTSWLELTAVRDRTQSALEGRMAMLDIDEERGRIVVATTSSEERMTLSDRLTATLGASYALLDIVEREFPRPDQATLQSRFRPLYGGVQIGPLGCTATVIAKMAGSDWRLLTNSHCTLATFHLDRRTTSQPWSTTTNPVPSWGVEGDRSPYFLSPTFSYVRTSDLAWYSLANLDYDRSTEVPFVPGAVAKPLFNVPGELMTYGPLEVDGTLAITALKAWPVVGEPLHRIGQRTGWRTGTVVRTCFTAGQRGHDGRWVTMPCQYEGTTFSEPGDSGSPMFQSIDLEGGG